MENEKKEFSKDDLKKELTEFFYFISEWSETVNLNDKLINDYINSKPYLIHEK